MVSSPSSKLKFFDESGKEIPSPVEGRECGIAIDIPEDLLPEISLRLGNVSLEILFDKKAKWVYAEWPACGPGNYELSLQCRGYQEQLQIALVPTNFNQNDFSALMSDLTEVLPMSIASQLQKCGAQLGSLDNKNSLENEYLEIRRAVTGTKERMGILQLLPIIERECHHILVPRTEIRNTNQVRRPDITKLSQIMSMPGNVLTPTKVYQMFDITVERSFDTYENRLVKAYVQALRSKLSRLQAQRHMIPPVVAREIETLINDFNLACARATFLREVKLPTYFAGRITMVLLKNHTYRQVFEDYLALNQQSSVSLQEVALNNPLNQFPFLYELWANLRVLNATLQACVDLGFRCASHNWVRRFNKRIFVQVMNDHLPAVELACPTTGRTIALVPWRPAGGSEALPDTPNRERLMALAMIIDVPGKPSAVLIFDPEYRVATKTESDTAGDDAKGDEEKGDDTTDDDSKAEESTGSKKGRKANRKKTLKTITARAASARATKTKLKAAKAEALEPAEAFEPKPTVTTIVPMKEDVDELLRCIEGVRAPDGSRRIQYAAILYPGKKMEFESGVEALPARPSEGEALQKSIYDVIRRYLT